MGDSTRHPSNNGRATLTGYVPRELRQAARDAAKARGISISAWVEEAVRTQLERDARKAIRGHLGAPGLRDPDAPCEDYEPGEQRPSASCETDGHYLCAGCVNREPDLEDSNG